MTDWRGFELLDSCCSNLDRKFETKMSSWSVFEVCFISFGFSELILLVVFDSEDIISIGSIATDFDEATFPIFGKSSWSQAFHR